MTVGHKELHFLKISIKSNKKKIYSTIGSKSLLFYSRTANACHDVVSEEIAPVTKCHVSLFVLVQERLTIAPVTKCHFSLFVLVQERLTFRYHSWYCYSVND